MPTIASRAASAIEAGAPVDPHRLQPAELLAHARRLAAGHARGALLVVLLNRSDRLSALAQQQPARIALGEVARRVEAILKPGDRYTIASHDELWVLLAGLPGIGVAEMAARTLRESLARPMPAGATPAVGPMAQMRPSVGGAWCGAGLPDDPMRLVRAATEACGRARRQDDPVALTPIEDAPEPVDRRRLEAQLRAALHANTLEVHFQPQVSMADGRCVGAEALLRWSDDGVRVDPALVASVAEESGLMGPLTQFVLNTALRHLMQWRTRGIDASVAINLSPVTLSDLEYPQLIAHALATWGVDPSRLTLEITESLIVRNEVNALKFMREVRALGCRLALDDFGTGYSTFAYLRRYPMDELKIDQSFVRHLATDQGDTRIVRSLVDLAHTFGLKALAEGVEDEASARIVAGLGCDLAQGYHFARPLPAQSFAEWYLAFNRRCAREAESVAP